VRVIRVFPQLSTELLRTYKRINEVYYKKKRERQRQKEVSKKAFDYTIRIGEVLNERYVVMKELGKGSFGQVVSAVDRMSGHHSTDDASTVAIKVIKSKEAFRKQAKTEIELLQLLNRMDPEDQWGVVRLKEVFEHENHICIVFEHLSFNLFEMLKRMKFSGVSLNLLRKFARQILKTLAFLRLPDVDIVHCDLKPENILIRNPNRSAIKVIDFGSSCQRSKRMYSYIQSRFYRSPEVILGMPYNQAIDMWSLGCILVELHTGVPLFAGRDEMDQMYRFVSLKGLPPLRMLDEGKKASQFFFREKQVWKGVREHEDPGSEPAKSDMMLKATTERSSGAASADMFELSSIPASAWAVGTEDETRFVYESHGVGVEALGDAPHRRADLSSKPAPSEEVAASSSSSSSAAEETTGPLPAVKDQVAFSSLLQERKVARADQIRERTLPVVYSLKPRSERPRGSIEQLPASDLRKVIGVHTHGPKGRRRLETVGHTVQNYIHFWDLIERMLDWDPETRIKPMQALNHPFLREDVEERKADDAATATNAPSVAAESSAASSASGETAAAVVRPEAPVVGTLAPGATTTEAWGEPSSKDPAPSSSNAPRASLVPTASATADALKARSGARPASANK
jgi:dual specificity tyrosine-phosphorylation-regulated kinase 1